MSTSQRWRRIRMCFGAGVFCGVCVVASASRADNWPAFRGADGRSVSSDKGLPVEFAPDKNVRWRVELPGKSNGSPIVWGDRVFVTQAVEKDKRRTLMCFGRADGKLLWQSGVEYADAESTHPENPYCSGTPATDGERVVACFGSAGLVCYDFSGKEIWRRGLGKLNHMFGNAISPVIVGDLVAVNFGPGAGARLVAVDKRTGEVKWEAKPPAVDEGEKSFSGERMKGPGIIVMMSLGGADKNNDQSVVRAEMGAAADDWFDKLDPEKAGKVAKQPFVERLGQLIGPPPGAPPGFAPAKLVGPALFDAADADKDGSVSRAELKSMFEGWHAKWSEGPEESIDYNQMLDGLNAMLPPLPQQPGGAAPPGAPADFGGDAGPGGSWSTPLLIHSNGRDELIVTFPNRLAAYDPKTGKPLWFAKGLPDSVQPMPMWDESNGIIVASGGDMSGGTLIAVRPGGSGDVTDSHRLWRLTRLKGSIGTGVVEGGRLQLISSDGFALCFDTKTGKKLWQKRLEGSGSRGSSWSSMLLADGKIFVPNQSGDVFVLGAGPKLNVLATNSVGEPTNTTPAASDGELFLRTDKSLWCIGASR